MSHFDAPLLLSEMVSLIRRARATPEKHRVPRADPPTLPAVARDYRELVAILDQRRKSLGIAHLALDDIAGVQQGYSGKVFAHMRSLGPVSLPALTGALKLRLVIEPAPDALPGDVLHRLPLLTRDAITFADQGA